VRVKGVANRLIDLKFDGGRTRRVQQQACVFVPEIAPSKIWARHRDEISEAADNASVVPMEIQILRAQG